MKINHLSRDKVSVSRDSPRPVPARRLGDQGLPQLLLHRTRSDPLQVLTGARITDENTQQDDEPASRSLLPRLRGTFSQPNRQIRHLRPHRQQENQEVPLCFIGSAEQVLPRKPQHELEVSLDPDSCQYLRGLGGKRESKTDLLRPERSSQRSRLRQQLVRAVR